MMMIMRMRIVIVISCERGENDETGNTTDKESHVRKLEKIFTYYKAASIVRMMESILTKVSSFRHSPYPVF